MIRKNLFKERIKMMTNIESQKLNDEDLEIVTGGKTFIVTVLKDMIIGLIL